MSVQNIVQLGEEFEKRKIRNYTGDDGKTYCSIIDSFAAVIEYPQKAWDRFQKHYPEMLISVHQYQFLGERQRKTSVAEGDLIIEMIMKLPGEKAREFSSNAAQAFLQALHPSEAYIEALMDRADELQSGSNPTPSLVTASSNVVHTFTRVRNQDETTLYIRGRKPEEFTTPSDFVKELTRLCLKFGITYYLHGRDGRYGHDNDNGYMMFSFHCANRIQARIIELLLIDEFSEAAVLGSREYIDVATAASILGCEYDPDSYASYVGVAQQLFAYMLERIHQLWPTYAHMYGCSYDIVANNSTLVRSTEDDSVTMHSELSFRCNVIDKERALQLALIKEQPITAQTPVALAESHVDPVHPSTIRMLGGLEDRSAVLASDNGAAVSATMRVKMERFIEEMCDIDARGTVTSKEISGQYRLWAREDGKIIFSGVLEYMKERFTAHRLEGQSLNTVVNGFLGVKLKPTPDYVLPDAATSQELFLFETCDRGPMYKCVQKQMVGEYKQWMEDRDEVASKFDTQALLDFMETNFFKANVWIGKVDDEEGGKKDDAPAAGKKKPDAKEADVSGRGYHGIGLKKHSHFYRGISSTAKRVWQINADTGRMIPVSDTDDSWPSVAKACEVLGWPSAKMSRAMESGKVYDGVWYTSVNPAS